PGFPLAGIPYYMGVETSIGVAAVFAAVLHCLCGSQDISVLIKDTPPHHPVCHGVQPWVVGAVDDILALHDVEVSDIDHQYKEESHKSVGHSSELFVYFPLFLFFFLFPLFFLFFAPTAQRGLLLPPLLAFFFFSELVASVLSFFFQCFLPRPLLRCKVPG